MVAFLDDYRPAAAKVETVLGDGRAATCSINLGEILYRQIRTVGETRATDGIDALREDMQVIHPNWDLVAKAARVKARGALSYADAFCVATAEHLGVPLWTGDPEIIDLADKLSCEVLDLRE